MPQPYVIVVVIDMNRRDDTLECLASLYGSTYANFQVMVLDCASRDGSAEAIASAYPGAEVIRLEENGGYAGNNNVGVRLAMAHGAEWIFVLNEDTALAPDCIAHMVAAGESDRQIGILGPMIYHYDEPEVIQSAGGRIGRNWEPVHVAQNESDRGQFSEPRTVDWVSGCGIMIRREALDQAGAFDERYFCYWEDVELCMRVREYGWCVRHVPQAKVWHKGVQRKYVPKPSVTYYTTRNRFLTMAEHGAPPTVRLFAWGQVVRTLATWTVKPKWQHMREHRYAVWRGTVDYLLRRWGQWAERESNG